MTKLTAILFLLIAGIGYAGTLNGHRFVDGQVIVKFKDQGIRPAIALSSSGVKGYVVENFSTNAALYNIGKSNVISAIRELSQNPAVAYAEPNYILTIDPVAASRTMVEYNVGEADAPNDPMYSQLYGMQLIKAPTAWQSNTGSKKILVGVIDTGVDYTHEDLADNIYVNAGEDGKDAAGNDKRTNKVDDDGNGYVDDWHGWDFANKDNDPKDDHSHGSHCAGTIGGVGNNGKGVVGVNWKVSILPIKFLTGSGSGTLADAVLSIEYGTKMKVNMTSNSWGGGGFTQTMFDAIEAANKAGILFIAAAGNSSGDNDKRPTYPGSYANTNIIAVAAVDSQSKMADFSCYGATSVDVGAPGVDILSTVINNGYKKFSGTSMATPHTAGATALVWATYPNLTHKDIKARMLGTVTPATALAGKTVTGGIINLASAMESDNVPPAKVEGLKVLSSDLTSATLEWLASGDDNTIGAASSYIVKVAETAIESDKDWDAATVGSIVPSTAKYGEKISAAIPGLAIAKTYFFAIRALDNINNMSALSASVKGQTANVAKLFEDGMELCSDSCQSWNASGGWMLSDKIAHSGKKSFALEVVTEDAIFATLDSDPISLKGNKQAFLSFWSKFNGGGNYGAQGKVFVSSNNGKTWAEVATAKPGEWTSEFIDLSPYLANSDTIMVKFAHHNTYKPAALTWYVDDVVVFVKDKD